MTDPLRGRATAFLLRISLFAGLLSVIAGILGMHVMAGGHSMHATAAASPAAVVSQQAVHHAATPPAPSCTSPGTCTEMSALHAVCVPAPGHNTLTAPLPGVPPYPNAVTAEAGAQVPGYSHRPGSPSPGDLCISRT
ncbi:hypothetical protein [Arthrobacter sp. FW306-2-2C-D06B]|uniref:hypothetical protein n=1 Tax=Arthrobacter sp. FW306-2-2C-D06B TaxID=2879618 RepID=UPI001F2D168B|nr:hypothetical protein [Arthrobacter sp. FW306-2-2C-D06B]UKA57148.1 hypothetical protein LFT47_12535 [Arthrobacter sp. FW306-2-2C-D06B]